MSGELTLATEAQLIIRDEYIERAAAELAPLSDGELRQRVTVLLDDQRAYLPDPAMASREDMIALLAAEDAGDPPTFAIHEDDDDPLVDYARELRREGWERNVTEI